MLVGETKISLLRMRSRRLLLLCDCHMNTPYLENIRFGPYATLLVVGVGVFPPLSLYLRLMRCFQWCGFEAPLSDIVPPPEPLTVGAAGTSGINREYASSLTSAAEH